MFVKIILNGAVEITIKKKFNIKLLNFFNLTNKFVNLNMLQNRAIKYKE